MKRGHCFQKKNGERNLSPVHNRELFHLQGDEADNMIKEIAWHWSRSECTMDVAVEDIVFAYVNEVVNGV